MTDSTTCARKGEWKLIRFYARNEDNTDRLELYNLKGDTGGAKNLAGAEPEVVKELTSLIDALPKGAEAAVAGANPAFGKKQT